MNVLRITFFLFTAGLVVSCNTFQPAAKSQVTNNLAAVESSISPKTAPRFIESIKVSPAIVAEANSVKPALPAAAHAKIANSEANTVKVQASGVMAAAASAVENSTMLQFKYAIALDVPVEQISNIALYESIDEWYGTRYRFGGTTHRGIDCSSLMQKLYFAAYGKEIPRTAVTQYAATTRLTRDELQEGDLLFFHTTRRGISHVGLYLGNDRFVHASSSRGVVISNLNEDYYVRAYRGAGRFVDAGMAKTKEEKTQETEVANGSN
jgi:cell wall-associated NlpC family hydrolase